MIQSSEAFKKFFIRTLTGHEIKLNLPKDSVYILGADDAEAIYNRLMNYPTNKASETDEEWFRKAKWNE